MINKTKIIKKIHDFIFQSKDEFVIVSKNKFRQHVPPMVDGVIPIEFEFETTQELLNHEFVQRFAKDMDGKKFYRFEMSDKHLMAVSDNGYFWWAVGRIERPEEIELEKWVPKYKDKK